jgi:rfaE bifunctional protein nucleotidyltransferase chain/domain
MAEPGTGRVVDLADLVAERTRWAAEGLTVVWTNGCFDLLHAGHVASLAAAARLGDRLVVGINDDQAVGILKGPGRPLVPAADRAAVMAALAVVDRAVVFSGLTPNEVLATVRPDIHCKGADYAPPNGKPVPERTVVEGYGGRVVFLPLVPARSTSALIARAAGAAGGGDAVEERA